MYIVNGRVKPNICDEQSLQLIDWDLQILFSFIPTQVFFLLFSIRREWRELNKNPQN